MILTFDDVLADPIAYRALSLQQPYGDVVLSNITFKGIATAPSRELLDWIDAHFEDLPAGPMTTFLRQSPAKNLEPNFVHTDRDMGAITGILYLNPEPAPGDGTAFWRYKETGREGSVAQDAAALRTEWADWRRPDLWDRHTLVDAKFNRLVLFPAALFHSRALFDNYGETPDAARLVQVCFLGAPYGGV
jgi:hypothetical protein